MEGGRGRDAGHQLILSGISKCRKLEKLTLSGIKFEKDTLVRFNFKILNFFSCRPFSATILTEKSNL
jgi:hypothetical protein